MYPIQSTQNTQEGPMIQNIQIIFFSFKETSSPFPSLQSTHECEGAPPAKQLALFFSAIHSCPHGNPSPEWGDSQNVSTPVSSLSQVFTFYPSHSWVTRTPGLGVHCICSTWRPFRDKGGGDYVSYCSNSLNY